MSVKSVSIRIEEEMLRKLGYIADYEGRSVNSLSLIHISRVICSNPAGSFWFKRDITSSGDIGSVSLQSKYSRSLSTPMGKGREKTIFGCGLNPCEY